FDGHGADFRKAAVVDNPGSPGFLNSCPRGRNASSRLARDDQNTNTGLRQVKPFLTGHLSEAKCVSRCAQNHGRLVIQQKAQASAAAHAAAWEAQVAQPAGALKRGPETQKRPEIEGEKQPVS